MLKIHPHCAEIPRLRRAAREDLRASLQEFGWDPAKPILITPDQQVLDGRHRAELAEELGLEPTYCITHDPPQLAVDKANKGRATADEAWPLYLAAKRGLTALQIERATGCTPQAASAAVALKDDEQAYHDVCVERTRTSAQSVQSARRPRPAPRPAAPKPPTPEAPALPLDRLLKALKQPRTYAELGARLKLDQPALSALLLSALQSGIELELSPTHVLLSTPAADQGSVAIEEPLMPVVGDWFRLGVIGDTHAGSKFMMRRELQDCVQWMVREKGVTRILHVGDWVQGCYTHSQYEVTTSGLDDQLRELSQWLPQIPGVKYIGIAGNHDETFTAKSGRSFARELHGAWAEFGRSDVQIVGAIGAFIRIGGTLIYLWHGGRPAYSLSYHLQRHAQQGFAALKPSILLNGHVHQSCHVETRGIECLLVPCFQGGASPFAKLFPGSPAIGGYVLNWRLQAGGSFRDFEVSKRRYYERERIHTDSNDMPGALVDPALASVTVVP
jgi:predicted phosphodiesterase